MSNERRQFNVSLPRELIRRLKIAAAEDEESLSNMVTAALKQYLDARDGRRAGK